MTIKALVIEQTVVGALDAASFQDDWFEKFNLPEGQSGLKRVRRGDCVYLLSEKSSPEVALLIVDLEAMKLRNGQQNLRYRFERIIRVALHHFNRSVSIPIKWQVFHQGSLISVYGDTLAKTSGLRLYFDQSTLGGKNIFAYGTSEGTVKSFETVIKNEELYLRAVAGYEDAARTETDLTRRTGNSGIILGHPLGAQLSGGATLDEWYDKRLTSEQRRFVDSSHAAPVRLRGAAGTGKTQAVAIKALRDLYTADMQGKNLRVAIIAHSSALAHDVLRGMFYALDPSAEWENLSNASLWTGTLYEYAQEILQYERKGLQPLSLDGRDGRTLQKLLINDALDAVTKNARISLGLLKDCSPVLQDRIASQADRTALVEDFANEIACVIEANNVRKGSKEADRYVKKTRESWQMALPTPADRMLALEVHALYEADLIKQSLLSMDQMMADFGRYLVSHEWRQLKERNGFDLVFVDEFHYFNRLEVMTFHSLFRERASISGKIPLFMAYDLKQSPTDTVLNVGGRSGSQFFHMAATSKTELVEFKTVFRYTPQICEFLKDLDDSFPAIGLEDEWQSYSGHSAQDSGDRPSLHTFATNNELLESVLSAAASDVREHQKGGRQVAILCLNERLFDEYIKSKRVMDRTVVLTSRDQINDLRYAKSRCIFSIPEYVAGLQFDVVYLIHVDRAELREADYDVGLYRRTISRSYLGASRAAKKLVLATSEERGGKSDILNCPLAQGSLTSDTHQHQ